MKKLVLLFCFFTFIRFSAQAQETIAKFKFEEAEEAFQAGQYETTISKLDEVEALLSGASPRTLYLRILAQDKIIARDPYASFPQLELLRANCQKYLKDYADLPSLEDKYRDVYKISEGLNKYPKTEEAFNVVIEQNLQRETARKKAAEEQAKLDEAKRQEEAKAKALEANEVAWKLKEEKKIANRSAFGLGFQGGEVATYGLTVTELKYKRIGFTMSLRSSLLPVKSLTRKELLSYQYTALQRRGKSLVTMGVTVPIIFPVWGYTTVGFGNYGLYDKYLDQDNKGIYVTNTDERVNLDTEVGLCLKLGFLMLRGGYSFTNFKNKELTYGVGINLLKKK